MDAHARDEELLEVQLKYCSTILAKLKRNANAGPFLKPVDHIALGIPDYHEKIKHPMDLSTIKSKLDSKVYESPDEFNSDMSLMFENCYNYNHPESAVYGMGKDLQKAYEGLYAELPMDKGPLGSGKRRRTVHVQSPVKQKRNIKSPESMSPEEYSFCADVLLELEKPKHRKYSWPFLFPVTEEDAPGYFSIITTPIDLSTIRSKLDNRKYSSSQEFTSDLELMIENCVKYNRPDTEVYKCGEEFNRVISMLIHKGRDVESKIAEIRKKISSLTQELRMLEQQSSKSVFSLSERERIGKTIIQMSKSQAENVAKIVHRHCAYEYVDNDEIEINLQTMPDEVVGEIDEYIQKIKNGEGDDASSASED